MLFQVIVSFGAAHFDPLLFGARVCDVLPIVTKSDFVLVSMFENVFDKSVEAIFSTIAISN